MDFKYSKDGITVTPILDTAHPKKSGKYPVRIRVCYIKKRRYYSTGKDLTADEWESLSTTKVRALVDVRKDIESSYQIVRGVVEELARDGIFSFDSLNKRLKRSGVDTLNRAFAAKIADLEAQERIGSMLVYDVVRQGLERFAGDRIALESVTVDWLRRYERFLLGEGKSRTRSEYICAIYGLY